MVDFLITGRIKKIVVEDDNSILEIADVNDDITTVVFPFAIAEFLYNKEVKLKIEEADDDIN